MTTKITRFIPGTNLEFNYNLACDGGVVNWNYSDSQGNTDSGSGNIAPQKTFLISSNDFDKDSQMNCKLTGTHDGVAAFCIPQVDIDYGPSTLQILNRDPTSPLTFHVEVTLRFVGISTETTYLEKLDSMDQFTKSQYIPRYRR